MARHTSSPPVPVQNNPAPASKRQRRVSTPRLSLPERRAQILKTAYDFFAKNGLNADTRSLAAACGVSQRLLYKAFPNKEALLDALYEAYIAGPVKAAWSVQLQDRSKPVEERIVSFCRDYYDSILTSRWLRLFLSAALADTNLAITYLKEHVAHLLETSIREAAHELRLQIPEDLHLVFELGWILHGTVVHLAIRRHIYHTNNPCPVDEVIALQVRCFLSGLVNILPAKQDYKV